MKQLVQRHPLLFATLLALTAAVFVPVGVRLTPGASVLSLVALLYLHGALFAIVLLTALGWWGQAGFNRPRRWHVLPQKPFRCSSRKLYHPHSILNKLHVSLTL